MSASEAEAEAVAKMKRTIRAKDLDAFKEILEQRLDLWTAGKKYFRKSRRMMDNVTLLYKLAMSDFTEGLLWYLQRCWQTVEPLDARGALSRTVITRKSTSRTVSKILLEAALAKAPQFLNNRMIYYYAMRTGNYDVAEQVVMQPEFQVNIRFRQSIHETWHLPIHDAVAHHQVKTIEIMVERGVKVDSLSNGVISGMMVACHLVYPHIVALLLRHGADPNYPPINTSTSEIENSLGLLTIRVRQERGRAVNEPTALELGINRNTSLTNKADYIVELLIEAGLRNPQKRFIDHSITKRHLSPEMANRLKKLNYEMRSLKALSFVKVRNIIRHRCKGVQFFKIVHSLPIPDWMKKEVTFMARP